ncbi:MAG: flagellar hook-basal body complex protein [Clostridia bacterium]|jgi:flagellar hook protein FlgE|nr:flagellar hook-basal body complex protein [Clostridiaceae bacterium]
MMRSLLSGVSGLKNHQTRMDVIGNNIANVNTVAYKSERVTFQDTFNQTLKKAEGGGLITGGTNPSQVGHGSSVASIDTIHTTGGVQRTDYPLDLSINGDGFFVVRDNLGNVFYTRAGNFHIDNNGRLVNANGLFVVDVNGLNITIPAEYTDIGINESGDVVGTHTVTKTTQVIAKIGIAVFPNNSGLSKAGESLYQATPASGNPKSPGTVYCSPGANGAGTVLPGTLELSNVDLTNEFSDMIVTQRGFQANARVITTSDSMLEEVVNLKR